METNTHHGDKMKTATRKQLESLDNVTITGTNEVEINVLDEETGRADYDATETLCDVVGKITGWGGYRTGYGSWVLSKGYAVSTGDYCDSSSSLHY